jgi:hypothetical protein
MSCFIVNGTGDNRADARPRVADCYDFFSLDGFRAGPGRHAIGFEPIVICPIIEGIEAQVHGIEGG